MPGGRPALSARARRETWPSRGSPSRTTRDTPTPPSRTIGRTWTAPVRLDEKQSVGHVDIELLDDGGGGVVGGVR